jgi:hypothetical protein
MLTFGFSKIQEKQNLPVEVMVVAISVETEVEVM